MLPSLYQYRLISESEIKSLDNIGTSEKSYRKKILDIGPHSYSEKYIEKGEAKKKPKQMRFHLFLLLSSRR